MTFLHRQWSRHGQATSNAEKDVRRASKPLTGAVENVAQQRSRTRTTSNMSATLIIKRVSSIFSSRRKVPADLKLVHSSHNPRSSNSSSNTLQSEEDDIRRPSGLGSAVSITSNRSLPPSPFHPPNSRADSPFDSNASGEYQRTRAISSPNLLRSLSMKISGKARARRASILATPAPATEKVPPIPTVAVPTPALPIYKASISLPEELVALVLSHLPLSDVAICTSVSRPFANASRASLYATIDTSLISVAHLEKLIAIIASRSDLAELVKTFICDCWPPFFISETRTQNSHVIQHKDALLTATFTLALERMTNLASLTLPAFDISLLAHHSAFGLKSLTFLHHTTTDAEIKALFSWLDGQTNITTLLFPNLDDTYSSNANPLSVRTNIPDGERSRAGTAPSSPYLKPFPTSTANGTGFSSPFATPASSPRSACFTFPSSPGSLNSKQSTDLVSLPFTSASLLPKLTTLHATPELTMLICTPLEDNDNDNSKFSSKESVSKEKETFKFPSKNTPDSAQRQRRYRRRPLNDVSLNINTTLYSGLRPASLMASLSSCGISKLALGFGDDVDRRTFEKVLGAAGAALGSGSAVSAGGGVKEMEDPFVADVKPPKKKRKSDQKEDSDIDKQNKEEQKLGLKSLEVSFQSGTAARSERDETLCKSLQASLPRYKILRSLRLFIENESNVDDSQERIQTPSTSEQALIDYWVRACPTLEDVTLFSGAHWIRHE